MSIKRFAEGTQKILVILLLLTFFWQTRIAFIYRYEVFDYLIPFVYLSDVLIIMTLISETIIRPEWLIKSSIWKNRLWVLGLVLVLTSFVAGFFFNSRPLLVAYIYKGLKLLLLLLFVVFIPELSAKYSVRRIMTLLSAGLLPLVLLGLIEMILGHSLSLKIIGEWTFSKFMPGIASLSIGSSLILRPYATFPHPNLFGAIMGVFAIYWLVEFVSSRLIVRKLLTKWLTGIFFFGVVLSFSRTAWLGLLLACMYVLWRRKNAGLSFVNKSKMWKLSLLLIALALLGLFRFNQLFGADSLSLLRRWELDKIAVQVWLKNPVFGVGLNQFLLVLDEYWVKIGLLRFSQPVHNIYLMVLAELGTVGFFGIAIALYSSVVRGWWKLPLWIRAVWIFILVTGLLDHYWWTLQQGLLVLSLTLGFTFVSIGEDEEV